MALLFANDFEGGSDGTTITTGNSGGDSGDAFSAVTIGAGCTVTYSNGSPILGPFAGKMVMAATAAATTIDKTGLGSQTVPVFIRLYLNKGGTPLGTWFDMVRGVDGAAARAFTFGITTGNLLSIFNAAGSSISLNSVKTIPSNQWVRLEFKVTPGAAANGQIEWRIYTSNPHAPVGAYDESKVSAANLTLGANCDGFRAGVISTPTNMNGLSWQYGPLAVSNDDWIGPVPFPPMPRRMPLGV